MLLARHHEGQVFVQLAPPIEAPWMLDLCERLAARWEPLGGSWAEDAATLMAAVSEAREWQEAYQECDDQQPLTSCGPGGNPPLLANNPLSMKASPIAATSRSACSGTPTGREVHTSPPDCGGRPATSTLKLVSFRPMSAVAARSMGELLTLGALGHG